MGNAPSFHFRCWHAFDNIASFLNHTGWFTAFQERILESCKSMFSFDFYIYTLMSFMLMQIDGFVQIVNVKVIMATNRDTLDPALLHPGRLDQKIEFPLPDRRQKRLIF